MYRDFGSKNELFHYLRDNQQKRGKDVSQSTLQAYTADIWDYLQYCKEFESEQPTPYNCEEGYLKALAMQYSYYSIIRKVQAVRFYLHMIEAQDLFTTQAMQALLSNIKRFKDLKQKQAKTFRLAHLKATVDALDDRSLRGIRNKAILLVGFATAMRKSELLSLRIGDIIQHEKGLVLVLGASKTNQFGEPSYKALFHTEDRRYDPVHWLLTLVKQLPEDPMQPLFTSITKAVFAKQALSGKGLEYVIKNTLGIDYSSHSFRASFISIARQRGLVDSSIMRQSHHVHTKSLDRYTRFDDIMEHNAAEHLGL